MGIEEGTALEFDVAKLWNIFWPDWLRGGFLGLLELQIRGRRDSQSRSLFEMRRDESLVSVSSQAFPESQSRSRVSKICTSLGLDLVSVSFFHCTLGVVLIWCHFEWKNVFLKAFLVKIGTL